MQKYQCSQMQKIIKYMTMNKMKLSVNFSEIYGVTSNCVFRVGFHLCCFEIPYFVNYTYKNEHLQTSLHKCMPIFRIVTHVNCQKTDFITLDTKGHLSVKTITDRHYVDHIEIKQALFKCKSEMIKLIYVLNISEEGVKFEIPPRPLETPVTVISSHSPSIVNLLDCIIILGGEFIFSAREIPLFLTSEMRIAIDLYGQN